MSSPNDDDAPIGPLTDQERDFLEAYRELDDAGRVRIWSTILTEVSRRPAPAEKEPPPLSFPCHPVVAGRTNLPAATSL